MSVIKLEHIKKSFGNRVIFDDFNLQIEAGEFLCISGESGKGKSTLLNIMGILDTPDYGDVTILGQKNPYFTTKSGKRLLRNEISYIFQNYGLVEDRSVKYNLEISGEFSRKNKKQDLIEALNKVGLNESFLQQKIYALSGGEQQRVALARLYLKDCSIVLADEPTGSLDAKNRENIMKILLDLNKKGITVIVVTHDFEVEKCASRVIKL